MSDALDFLDAALVHGVSFILFWVARFFGIRFTYCPRDPGYKAFANRQYSS